MLNWLRSRFSPFRYFAFRWFFFAQTLSLVGTWAHELARSWLVIDLTGNATALGTLTLASAVPSLFLILQAGVWVDSWNVKRLIITTKLMFLIMSLSLALFTHYQLLSFQLLFVVAIVEGITTAFDFPAFSKYLVRLVPPSELQQSIALNQTNFHVARMLGPLIAGLLMAWRGPVVVFLFDAVTYMLLIAVVLGISFSAFGDSSAKASGSDLTHYKKTPSAKGIKEGLSYLIHHLELRYMLAQLLVTIGLIFPLLIVVFRVYVQKKYQLTAEQFGYVFAFPALGAALGAISIAAIKPQRPLNALYVAVPALAVSSIAAALVTSLQLTTLAMALSGFFAFLCFSALTLSLHLQVEERFRGRMASVIGLGFVSIGPLMGLPIGAMADQLGYQETVIAVTVLFTLTSIVLYRNQQKLRRLTPD